MKTLLCLDSSEAAEYDPKTGAWRFDLIDPLRNVCAIEALSAAVSYEVGIPLAQPLHLLISEEHAGVLLTMKASIPAGLYPSTSAMGEALAAALNSATPVSRVVTKAMSKTILQKSARDADTASFHRINTYSVRVLPGSERLAISIHGEAQSTLHGFTGRLEVPSMHRRDADWSVWHLRVHSDTTTLRPARGALMTLVRGADTPLLHVVVLSEHPLLVTPVDIPPDYPLKEGPLGGTLLPFCPPEHLADIRVLGFDTRGHQASNIQILQCQPNVAANGNSIQYRLSFGAQHPFQVGDRIQPRDIPPHFSGAQPPIPIPMTIDSVDTPYQIRASINIDALPTRMLIRCKTPDSKTSPPPPTINEPYPGIRMVWVTRLSVTPSRDRICMLVRMEDGCAADWVGRPITIVPTGGAQPLEWIGEQQVPIMAMPPPQATSHAQTAAAGPRLLRLLLPYPWTGPNRSALCHPSSPTGTMPTCATPGVKECGAINMCGQPCLIVAPKPLHPLRNVLRIPINLWLERREALGVISGRGGTQAFALIHTTSDNSAASKHGTSTLAFAHARESSLLGSYTFHPKVERTSYIVVRIGHTGSMVSRHTPPTAWSLVLELHADNAII